MNLQWRQTAARRAITGLVVAVGFVSCSVGLAAERTTEPAEVARQVDQQLAIDVPATASKDAAPRAGDMTFLRRVSLDLVGQSPTPEQITRFVLEPDPHKRTKLVERLMADDQYAENWSRYWRDVIFYRRTEDRAVLAIDNCTNYLADQFRKNTPWDEIATAFVTASGDVLENGDTGLILAQGGETEGTVAEISRIFLGIQIQCAQCHDHPTDRWKREQFHQLAAFFPRVAVRPSLPNEQRTFTVTATDVEPRQRPRNAMQRVVGSLEHYMPDLKDPTAKGTLMAPVFFVTGQKLDTGSKDIYRRGQLAAWITAPENPWFARAFVNRIWSELVGEGFYEPVDDMGPDRDCSAPKTLELLAQSFVQHGHDVKWLLRTITATDAYQRASRPRRNPDDPPFLANTPQRLRGDQLFNQLTSLLGIDERDLQRGPGGGGGGPYQRRGPRNQFNAVFGYDPSSPREEVASSIPQALTFMNGQMLNQSVSANRGRLSGLVRQIHDNDDLVVELYLWAVGREPTSSELETCQKYFREAPTGNEAAEDLYWSLLNSAEFRYRP